MFKPVGGRGNKAPYETVVERVPAPLAEEVRRLAAEYRDLVNAGLIDPKENLADKYQSMGLCSLTFSKALEESKKLLAQKKSAKKTVVKLLQVLYGVETDVESFL